MSCKWYALEEGQGHNSLDISSDLIPEAKLLSLARCLSGSKTEAETSSFFKDINNKVEIILRRSNVSGYTTYKFQQTIEPSSLVQFKS